MKIARGRMVKKLLVLLGKFQITWYDRSYDTTITNTIGEP